MATLSTAIALRLLLSDDDYLLRWLRAGYTKADRSRFRYRLEEGKLSIEKMEEVLADCGFTVAVEKQWHKPNALGM